MNTNEIKSISILVKKKSKYCYLLYYGPRFCFQDELTEERLTGKIHKFLAVARDFQQFDI